MESYPAVEIRTLEDVVRYLSTVREFRERDITDNNNLQQVAAYDVGFRKTTQTVTTDTALGSTTLSVDVNATAGATTITLTPSPFDGQEHRIFKNDASGNNVVVSGNGKNINGGATISWSTRYQGRLLIYMGGTGEWRAATL